MKSETVLSGVESWVKPPFQPAGMLRRWPGASSPNQPQSVGCSLVRSYQYHGTVSGRVCSDNDRLSVRGTGPDIPGGRQS